MSRLLASAAALALLTADLPGQCLQNLVSPQASSSFGQFVALDGDLAVAVEQSSFNPALTEPSTVHFYSRDDQGHWSLDQSVATQLNSVVSGGLDAQTGRLVLGQPWWGSGQLGQVTLLERPSPDQPWAETQVLQSPAGILQKRFGWACAWSDTQLFVTAPGQLPLAQDQVVQVYERAAGAGTWTLAQTIPHPADSGYNFGYSLGFSGGELHIGDVYYAGGPGPIAGAVHHYARNSSGLWTLEGSTEPASGQTGEFFGCRIEVQGEHLVVGAQARNFQGNPDAGALYHFERQGPGSWVEIQRINAPNPATEFGFGGRLAFDGTDLFVQGSGYSYRFGLAGGAFVSLDRIDPPVPALTFASVLAADQGTVLLAAEESLSASDPQGFVHILDLADRNQDLQADACQNLGTRFCGPAVENSTGQSSRIYGLGTGAPLAGFDIAVDRLPPAQFGYGIVSMGTGLVMNPGGSAGNLCIADPELGRYTQQVLVTGPDGAVYFGVDPSSIPQASGSASAAAGETWNFQYWHRDSGATSNFSDALALTF